MNFCNLKGMLKVKDLDIATGGTKVVLINEKDARALDIHHMDRVEVNKGKKTITAIVDIAESAKAVPAGKIGLFEEVLEALKVKNNDVVCISNAPKPESLTHIKNKLDGKELTYEETACLVKDIVDEKLSMIELTSYVAANYTLGMTRQETLFLTKAMINTGNVLKHKTKIVADLHSIGGVPGNRTTMIVIPIIISAGITIPKTSSRAITSPAGTADTMEVFCPVSVPMSKVKSLLNTVGGFILWGGSINLAPADEKIIRVESPLSIDPEGQMLASILAKKASVGATHLIMELPVGKDVKLKNLKEAHHLKEEFEYLCKQLGIKINVLVTNSEEPIGNGIGPVLEAIDVLKVLQNFKEAPQDLRCKSLEMAGILFELVGKTKNGNGRELAKQILDSGQAYKTFLKMVKAQGGPIPDIKKLKPGKHSFDVLSTKTGRIKDIDNKAIAKIARIAGAPKDKHSGIYLYKHMGDKITKGEKLFTIYANSNIKLNYAKQANKQLTSYII